MNEKIRIRLKSYDHTVVNNEVEVLETFEASEVYTLGNKVPIAVVTDLASETGEVLSEFPVFYDSSFQQTWF
ncbi:hypothetical protein [Lyngbya sp. PCC 8106]|uniref:hypothetical protein n=1 Tax=Lyngbya sp. (strain PCC 8106) TaxID=313612 RepID=UPI0000EA9946|nr:hypothetical protein [Lyngbya sp. PCC 8106]EAW35178.1 hypothetical protein L8106_13725 [Lyngbya sp. PCC 8106]